MYTYQEVFITREQIEKLFPYNVTIYEWKGDTNYVSIFFHKDGKKYEYDHFDICKKIYGFKGHLQKVYYDKPWWKRNRKIIKLKLDYCDFRIFNLN